MVYCGYERLHRTDRGAKFIAYLCDCGHDVSNPAFAKILVAAVACRHNGQRGFRILSAVSVADVYKRLAHRGGRRFAVLHFVCGQVYILARRGSVLFGDVCIRRMRVCRGVDTVRSGAERFASDVSRRIQRNVPVRFGVLLCVERLERGGFAA